MKNLESKMKLAGLDTDSPVGTVICLPSEEGEWRFFKNRRAWHYLGHFTSDGEVSFGPRPEWMVTR